MPQTTNGGIRTKNIRESYAEQSPYVQDRKRKSFTRLRSLDDSGVSYQSTPEYLRQLMNTSTSSNGYFARNTIRTKSASEMTPRNNSTGNPKYKAQEDYYDEIQSLKKELQFVKDDNNNMRAKIRRLEEDNARKCKEIDNIYDTNKDGDLRRTLAGPSTDRSNIPTSNVVMSLKQRIFKLELQMKQRETTIDEMKNNPRWTKGTELEIQNRALFNELERQKLERLNYIQQNDYMASIDEEKKNAVRKLEAEKRELKLENESLKKKVREMEKLGRGEQLSARQEDGNTDRDLLEKIEDLKQECRNRRDELDRVKTDLKQMRRERDQYRDKFDTTKEDLEEIKREREHYRKKLDRVTHDFEEADRHTKFDQTGRSSPALKRDEERHRKHRDSSSSEERTKKDSSFHLPLRKSNEQIGPRSSAMKLDRSTPPPFKTSTRNLRGDRWTKDDENRVKHFREKHAAKVIQREWRRHNKSHKSSLMNKSRQDSFDKRNSKIGSMKQWETQSPRASQQKLGSKIDNLGSGTIKNRPGSPSISNESALKTVQASLRGYLNRMEIDKTTRPQKSHRFGSDDEEDIIVPPSRQYGNERNRESFLDHSKHNLRDNDSLRNDKIGSNSRLPTNTRDSVSKFRRSPSPPRDSHRPSSPHVGSAGGSKQVLPYDKNNFGSGNRFSINDREFPTKTRRTPSPPLDAHRPSSPRVGSAGGSQQAFPIDKNKFGSGNRFSINDRESPSKIRRSPSPPLDAHRPSSPRVGSAGGSQQAFPIDKNKFGSGNRFSVNDRESPSKIRRTPSPPADGHRPSSPRVGSAGGSKQALPYDKNKFGSDGRNDRESVSKLQRPFSPANDHRLSRINTANSKQSLKNHDDDDDVLDF